ncbi:DUF1858 domain-containing protein [Candidatus Woesearchaeota archaeon]|nr:DUF1858 domain-containing protein [Candidatus Woesearchaeota archaeon]
MSIQELVSKHEEVVHVLFEHGMHCVGCVAGQFENIEQAAQAHGIDVDKLVEELNKAVAQEKNKKK